MDCWPSVCALLVTKTIGHNSRFPWRLSCFPVCGVLRVRPEHTHAHKWKRPTVQRPLDIIIETNDISAGQRGL